MLAILQQFHTYLPRTADGGYDPQLFAGDQLTIERAVNVIWHAGVKILSVSLIFCSN